MIKSGKALRVQGDRSFHITNTVILTLLFAVVLYPVIYVISCSFSSAYSVVTNKVWLWPVDVTLDGYKAVFEHPLIMKGYFNSLIYMVFGTAVNIVLLLLAGFPLSRRDMPGRKLVTIYFMLTMFFNGGMIPNYLLVKNIGMMNTRIALIIPFAFSAYNMVIVRTFFKSNLPDDLMEAANIDGCGDIRFFMQIALPLAKPVIAVMVLLHGIGHWNGYMRALLYVTDSDKYTLQLVLRDILMISKMPTEMLAAMSDQKLDALRNAVELIRYSVIVVGALPVLILYPFVQKYFVKGIMIGSIKG